MRQVNFLILKFILITLSLVLISCQEGVRPLTSNPPPDPDPRTDPLVRISFNGFDPETTTLRFSEGETVTFELDTVDSTITSASLAQISGPIVNFGNVSTGGTVTVPMILPLPYRM